MWVRALILLEERFDAVALSYKLGQQDLSTRLGIAERVVATYVELADRVTGRDRMLRNAVWTAEATKSRLLTDLIGRGHLPAPPGVPADRLSRERTILDELRAIDTAALAGYGLPETGGADPGARRRKLHDELHELWDAIASSGEEGREYVALRRRQPLTWDTIAELAALAGPSTALASLFLTNTRALLFVIRHGVVTPALCEIAIDRDGWIDVMDRFDREVRRGAGQRKETWDERLRPLLREALPHIDGVERVVLAPAVWGVQLPWSAVARRAGWRSANGGTMPLVTVESFSLLHRVLASNRPGGPGGRALVVGDPTGDLEHAGAEAAAVGALVGVEPLIGPAATRAAVLASMRAASMVHIAGHASFEASAPLDSGIVLADGLLTARDIMAERIQLDLVVLSACQTGVAESLGGNEFAGLTQAFHVAGVRSVVGSLWKVDDPVTAVLMAGFYRGWRAGSDLARALRDAMDPIHPGGVNAGSVERGLRDVYPADRAAEPSPATYYSNSFVLSGDWAAPELKTI